jgi:hypothetical protein
MLSIPDPAMVAPRKRRGADFDPDLAALAPAPAVLPVLRHDPEFAVFDHDLGLGEHSFTAMRDDARLPAGLDRHFIGARDRHPVERANLVGAVNRGSRVARFGVG